MTCLDSDYGNVVQCQNIVYVLNEHEVVQPKWRNLEMSTNDHDKSETQSDMVEELIQVETDDNVLNESTCQPIASEEINRIIESNQNKILKQTEVEVWLSPGCLRKVECTH